jgi:putative ABC transport system ATP-binding protein
VALIHLKNVHRRFTMGSETIHALDGVSLDVERGELVSIIGPSGCGKSTLMNLLGLLDAPDEGEFQFDGKNVAALTDSARAQLRNQEIGFVFQSFNLLPRMSALRNVEMPLVYSASYAGKFSKAEAELKARKALTRVGLGDRMDHAPNELSGGQRQRVAIARAIVNNPRVVLADEPTGNLDSKSGKEIMALFGELHREGVTLILVTHDPSIAAASNRRINMLDGRVLRDERGRES